MIRVNLLKARAGSGGKLQTILAPRGRSTFISGREIALGSLLLLAGAGMFMIQFQGASGLPFAGQPAEAGELSPGAAGASTAEAAAVDFSFEPVLEAPSHVEPAGRQDSEQAGSALSAQPSLGAAAPTAPSWGPESQGGEESGGSALAGEKGHLTQLFVSNVEDTLRIFAGTGVQPEYRAFRLENPNRIVIDLPGVVMALPAGAQDQPIPHSQIARVRAAQYRVDPPLARLVLDVKSFPEVQFFPQFNGLYIRIPEKDE